MLAAMTKVSLVVMALAAAVGVVVEAFLIFRLFGPFGIISVVAIGIALLIVHVLLDRRLARAQNKTQLPPTRHRYVELNSPES